jgi:hypothetical protein
VSREVEGLPWPEGDPDGLRGIASHALGLATELEHRQAFVKGLDPTGWIGVGRDEFAVSLAEHAHALGSGAGAMHAAAGALFKLAQAVEDAQHTVLEAARKLKAARDAAHKAQTYAQSARATADTDGLKLLTGPLSTPGNPVQTPSEIEADRAENAAATAQSHALDVERWAQRQARTANDDVDAGDRSTAGVLEHAGLVSAGGTPSLVGVAPPTPTDPLQALGQLLLGPVGSQGDLGLKALLSSPPPPPPPPPPKPVPEHHGSFWNKLAVGGMAVVTTGLVVVDALQLGLDPVTDGATVAAGGETVALATDAAVDAEVVAGTAGTEAAVTETEEAVIAAEGAPSEGLAVQEGAADAPVRPSWRDSEVDAGKDLAGKGYREQVSFKDGEEVPYGTKGSTRPDHYAPGNSVEIKNYDVTSSAGRSRLVRNVVDQATKRAANLPEGTTQTLRIDVRGQDVPIDTLNEMASRIAARTGGRIDMSQIRFVR